MAKRPLSLTNPIKWSYSESRWRFSPNTSLHCQHHAVVQMANNAASYAVLAAINPGTFSATAPPIPLPRTRPSSMLCVRPTWAPSQELPPPGKRHRGACQGQQASLSAISPQDTDVVMVAVLNPRRLLSWESWGVLK